MEHFPLTANWLETQNVRLLDTLLSDPILKFYEAEGFTDTLYAHILEITGWYPDTSHPDYDADALLHRETAHRYLQHAAKVAQQLGFEIIDITAGDDSWAYLKDELVRISGLPEPMPITYFRQEDSSASMGELVKLLQKVATDGAYTPEMLSQMDHYDASPTLAAISQLVDKHLCGENRFANICTLDRFGFEDVVTSRDSCGPTSAKILMKKGAFYYG